MTLNFIENWEQINDDEWQYGKCKIIRKVLCAKAQCEKRAQAL